MKQPLPHSQSHSQRWLVGGLAAAVAVVVVACHWPVLNAQALWMDDDQYLTKNPLVANPGWSSAGRFLAEVRSPSTVDGYYQPLAMISLMLDYGMGGRPQNLAAFHRTSLGLHAANAVLVMLLVYLLFSSGGGHPCPPGVQGCTPPIWAAVAVGVLFGVHPLSVETIAWIGERKTLLATLFTLLCILSYVRYASTRSRWLYAACLASYLLAVMSKPTSVPVPAVLLLLDYWPLNRVCWRTVIEKVPLFVVAAVSAVITVLSQQHLYRPPIVPLSAGQQVLLAMHNVAFYPAKMIWPSRLSSFYAFPQPIGLTNPKLLVAVVVCTLIVVMVAISLRWSRAWLTGGLCYFVLLAPTLLNKSYSQSVAWNKYVYLPAVGLLLVLVALGAVFDSPGRDLVARRSVGWSRTCGTVALTCGTAALGCGTGGTRQASRGFLMSGVKPGLSANPGMGIIHNGNFWL